MDSQSQYKRHLSNAKNNSFLLPEGYCVLRNATKSGKLIHYKSEAEYRKMGKIEMWVILKMRLFRDKHGVVFPIYQCQSCSSMANIDKLSFNQELEELKKFRCIHSKTCEFVVNKEGSWKEVWNLKLDDIYPDTEFYEPSYRWKAKCFQTLREDDLFLVACFQEKGERLNLLSTLNTGQKCPDCTKCSTRGCKCFKEFKATTIKEHKENNPKSQPDLFCNRRTKKTIKKQAQKMFKDEDFTEFHNKTKIRCPIWRDPAMQSIFDKSRKDEIEFPDSIIPEYNGSKCIHGHEFDKSDQRLKLLHEHIKIYSEYIDMIKDVRVYGRPTVGGCQCIMQADTTLLGLWNMGAGSFLKLEYLLHNVHKYSELNSITSAFKSRQDTFSSLGYPTDLDRNKFTKSVIGFCENLVFNREDWMCDGKDCGETPKLLVGDGKVMGPATEKVKNISELGPHPSQKIPLPQGSFSKDRMFLGLKEERLLMTKLITEEISPDEFLEQSLESENGKLVYRLGKP